jgi:hypothetical protein
VSPRLERRVGLQTAHHGGSVEEVTTVATRIEAIKLRSGHRIWLDGQTASVSRVKHDPERACVLVDTTDDRVIICDVDSVLTLDEDSAL